MIRQITQRHDRKLGAGNQDGSRPLGHTPLSREPSCLDPSVRVTALRFGHGARSKAWIPVHERPRLPNLARLSRCQRQLARRPCRKQSWLLDRHRGLHFRIRSRHHLVDFGKVYARPPPGSVLTSTSGLSLKRRDLPHPFSSRIEDDERTSRSVPEPIHLAVKPAAGILELPKFTNVPSECQPK